MSDHDDVIDVADHWWLGIKDVPDDRMVSIPAGVLRTLIAEIFILSQSPVDTPPSNRDDA